MTAVVMSVTHLTFWPNRDPPVTADKLTTFTLYVHVQSCVKQLVMSVCMSMFAITMLCPSVQLGLSHQPHDVQEIGWQTLARPQQLFTSCMRYGLVYTGSMTGVYYICDPFDFWPNWDPPVAVDKLTIFTPMWKVVISNWFCLSVCSSFCLSVCPVKMVHLQG